MRDPAALLTSLVAVERQQLLAILDAEKRAAEDLSRATPRRTPKQRARGEEAARRAARLDAMLAYFREGAAEGLSAADLSLCLAVEQKLDRHDAASRRK